jgi:hypothetical protein
MQYFGDIGGNIFHDLNSNGYQDYDYGYYYGTTEPGLRWTITLTKPSDPTFSRVTYAETQYGYYSFGSFPVNNDSYLITVTPPSADWELSNNSYYTNPQSVSLSVDPSYPYYGLYGIGRYTSFAYRQPETQISGNLYGYSSNGGYGTSLGGWIVYLDSNNSGSLDSNERRVLTNGNGYYTFLGLEADTSYTVGVVPQSSAWSGYYGGYYGGDFQQNVTTTLGEVTQIYFSLYANVPSTLPTTGLLSAISGVIWNDVNGDNYRNEYDPSSPYIYSNYGLAGWTVDLLDSNYSVLERTQTDFYGRYTFEGLGAGNYRVQSFAPFTGSVSWQSTNYSYYPSVTLASNERVTDIDLGFQQQVYDGIFYGSSNVWEYGDIGGYVWNDSNGDTYRPTYSYSGEYGLGGWKVNLLQDGQIIQTTTTDTTGYYGFSSLSDGSSYTVTVESPYAPDEWQATTATPDPIDFNGYPIRTVDFGYQSPFPYIQGFVWNDVNGDTNYYTENGLVHWQVNLSQNGQTIASTASNGGGSYNFGSRPYGDYTVTVVPLDNSWSATTPVSKSFTLSDGNYYGNYNTFGFQGTKGAISGFLWKDVDKSGTWEYYNNETILSNWTVYLDQDNDGTLDSGETSTVTDSLGGYGFDNLAAGTYNVRVSTPSGWHQTAPSTLKYTKTVTTSEIYDRLNFGYAEGEGTVVNHPPQLLTPLWGRAINGNTVIPGVFGDIDGDSLTSTATRGDGTPLPTWFSISVLSNGDLSVTINNAPTVYTPFYVKVTASDGQASTDLVFRIYPNNSGFVIDNYIAGATVFFDADKDGILDANEPFTTTDADGFYQLDIPDSFDTNGNTVFDPSEGTLVAFGGVDTATGLPLETPVSALPGSTTITLLTTLVAELVDQGLTVDQANDLITTALALPNTVDLSNIDPVDATKNNLTGASDTYTAMVQVQNVITQIAGLLDGASNATPGAILDNVVAAIADTIQTGNPLDLTDVTQVQTLIETAATSTGVDVTALANGSAQVIAAANQEVETLSNNTPANLLEEEFAKVQKVALGATTNDLEAAGAGTKPINEVVAENTGTALTDQVNNAQVLSQAPTDLSLSNLSIKERRPVGTEIGTLSTVDPDTGETFTYTLVGGVGGEDNAQFEIVGNSLKTKAVFDYETKATYSVRLQTSDGNGGVLQKNLSINVLDVSEVTGGAGNDILTGTAADDVITGLQGSDILYGLAGNDEFVYTSFTQARDTIKDFTVGSDKINLSGLLSSFNYGGSNPISDGYVLFGQNGANNSLISIDPDGLAGTARSRSFLIVENVSPAALNNSSNFIF